MASVIVTACLKAWNGHLGNSWNAQPEKGTSLMSTRRHIAGFPICNTTTKVFTRFLNRRLGSKKQTVVLFANANLVTCCSHLRQAIQQEPDLYVLNDGIALDAASWLMFGSTFRENMNGTDFTPVLLKNLKGRTRVFLLGGSLEAVTGAAAAFDQYPRVEIVGTTDGYSIWHDQAETVNRIKDAQPDILLVAFGNPLQEEWILKNKTLLDVPLIIGVGALFDFVSGVKPRAPDVIRNLRLEWAHRLALEPQRLVRRYTIGILRFFVAAIFYNRQRSIP
jgi:beta-1,4-glucosyltransferase